MRIAELTAYVVRVPLRREIQHASASRQESTNLVVRCRLENGKHYRLGRGRPPALRHRRDARGCPATIRGDGSERSAAERLWQLARRYTALRVLPALNRSTVLCGLSRKCTAVRIPQLSVLDAYGRHFGEPLSSVARYFPATQDFIRDPVSVAILLRLPPKRLAANGSVP